MARKDDLIRIRVTTGHRRILQEAADREGLDLSSWVRMSLLRAARPQQ
ncbi:MAG: hypothetical protein QME96_14055 [Myxococcota bacterium]|nr:hypothetical protein [Myxococcota bacterium]